MPSFKLKNVTDDDHEWLCNLHNDPIVLRNVTDPSIITLESHMNWWNSRGSSEQYKIFAVDEKRVGFAKFRPIDNQNRNVVLGADIHKDHRGKGYAKHMWSMMLDECFNELGMHRASLVTAAYNERGIHIYKKIGFKEEGRSVDLLYRDGEYHDVICMYVLEHEWRNNYDL